MPFARMLSMSLFAMAVSTVTAQTQGVHPGFTLTNLRPSGFNPMVGGLDFLSDGRLVVATWEGFSTTKGNVYIVSNVQGGDADKKKVTLTIPGMLRKDVIYIKLSNVMSATGNVAPWSTETWYTLNAFGPGSPRTQVGPSTAVDRKQPKVNVRALAGGKVSFRVASAGNFSLDIRDAQGGIVENRAGTGPMEMVSRAVYGRGVYLMTFEECRRSLPSTHCESLKV